MTKFLPAALAALLLASCTTSHRVLRLDQPPVNADSIDIGSYIERYGEYDGVMMENAQSFDHFGNKSMGPYSFGSWNFLHSVRRKYMVLNPDAQNLTTFTFSAPKDPTLGTVYMKVSRPDGSVSHYGLKDMARETDSDGDLQYKFAYPDITRGCIVEEGFEIVYNALGTRPPLDHDVATQFYIPCEKFTFTYAYPDWWTIAVKKIAPDLPPSVQETVDKEHHKKILKYSATDIPVFRKEEYSPFPKEIYDYLEFMVTEMNMVSWHYKGSQNWKQHVNSFKRYVINRDGFLSTKVSRTTERLTDGVTDPATKIDSIVSFIQENIKIASDYEDRNFADILDDKKGNVYAITGLAHSMLEKAGFAPQYVLVHSAEEGYCDRSFYNFSQFSIPAVIVAVDTGKYVLMPYRRDLPIDVVPSHVQGQPALVIDERATADVLTVPDNGGASTVVSDEYDVTVSPEGSLTVVETTTLHGTSGFYFRNLIRNMNAKEREQFIVKRIIADGVSAELESYSIADEAKYKNPLVITVRYIIRDLVTVTEDEVIFQPAGLFTPTALKDSPIETEKRTNPIRIYFNERFTKSITVHYPVEWRLSTELMPGTVHNAIGTLSAEYRTEPGTIKATFRREIVRGSHPKEKIGDLTALVGENSSLSMPTLILAIGGK